MRVLALLAVLFGPWSGAEPPIPLDPAGASCQRTVKALVAEWGDRAEASIWCVPYTADGTTALYRRGTRRAEVEYLAGVSESLYRHQAAHELGHAWDYWNLTKRQRKRYARIRGIPFDGWRSTTDAPEDYADVFAEVFNGPAPPDAVPYSRLVAPVTPELVAKLCRKELLPC